jgi:copper(I)-binding protein
VDTHKTEGIFHFTVASMAASMGAMPGMAAEAPAGAAIVASEAWARATPPNGRTAAAYLTLTDNGPPDHVVGASTPVAGSASVHETTNDNGVMKMRAVPSLPLDTGKPVAFAPGGYHVMLMDLKHPLKAGDHFPLTLTFEHAPKLTVEVAVQAMGAAPPMAMSMPMGGMNMGGASK